MKLSDIRGCDGCHGLIFTAQDRCFHVVRTTTAIVSRTALEVAAAAVRNSMPLQRLRGDSPAAIAVLGDADPAFTIELHLCTACFSTKPLAAIARRRVDLLEARVARRRVS